MAVVATIGHNCTFGEVTPWVQVERKAAGWRPWVEEQVRKCDRWDDVGDIA